MNLLKSDEYPAVYAIYIDTVVGDVLKVLEEQLDTFPAFLSAVPAGKSEYSYAEGKWSIKEVIGHILDTERIMTYRALRFSRNDTKALVGFEEEEYVRHGHFNDYSLEYYAKSFVLLRKSNLMLFKTFGQNELNRKGLVSDRLISVRALLHIVAGHLTHHQNIIKDRYLKN